VTLRYVVELQLTTRSSSAAGFAAGAAAAAVCHV
jgi:hypothetical protein